MVSHKLNEQPMAPRKFNKVNTNVVDTDIHGAKPNESSKESNDFKV